MGQHTGNEMQGGVGERPTVGAPEQAALRRALLPQRDVKVQPAAGLIGKGLGHQREHHAAGVGQGLRRQLEQHQVVGAGQRLVIGEVHLVLTVRVFVVELQYVQAASGERLAQLMQETGLSGQRLQVVAWLVQAVGLIGRHPIAVLPAQQEELGLQAGAQHPPTLSQAGRGALEHLPRTGVEGLAIDEAVAHDARHPRHPGYRLHGGGVAPGVVLRAQPRARQAGAPDGRAGKARPVAQHVLQMGQRHELALGAPVHVGELHEQGVHARSLQAAAQVAHGRPRIQHGGQVSRWAQKDTTTEAPSRELLLR